LSFRDQQTRRGDLILEVGPLPENLAAAPANGHSNGAVRGLAEITHRDGYAGLVAAFRRRSAELAIPITSEAVAQIAGIPSHYFAKILSPSPNPAKRFGSASLGPILGCLGLKIVLVEDSEALARYTARIPQRSERSAHSSAFTQTRSRQFMRKIGKIGAQKRWEAKKRRVRAASHAARIRWHGGNGAAAGR
jgi:hypothetical protein